MGINIKPNLLDMHSDMIECINAKKNMFKYQDSAGMLMGMKIMFHISSSLEFVVLEDTENQYQFTIITHNTSSTNGLVLFKTKIVADKGM